jgi:2-amino-4-hydroxy-6-hydroxymethyldihydropteridine diphosphokinase
VKPGTAWVGLGANLGDPLASLARAVRLMRRMPSTRVTGVSPVFRTSPVGVRRQPWFHNAAARVSTRLGPGALIRRLLAVERKIGRRRSSRSHGDPRVIDLDLLLLGECVYDSGGPKRDPAVVIPHPRLHLRRFAMRPIVALDSGVRHPVFGLPLRRILTSVPRGQRVRVLPPRDQRRFRRLLAGRSA